MASGWTNKGKFQDLSQRFRATTIPTTYNLHLINSTPTADTNTMADVTNASNYTEENLAKNATDFDVITEDDGADTAFVQVRDVVFTASGGTITTTFAVLADDNATESLREIYCYWDLGGAQNIPNGDTLTLKDCQQTITE
ncbi:MAG: hypothetical protein V3U84_02345 [Thiotrichaceae bacterium]